MKIKFAIGTNMRITSHGLFPRAVQIFAHITMAMMKPTSGIKNRIIVQTGNWALEARE